MPGRYRYAGGRLRVGGQRAISADCCCGDVTTCEQFLTLFGTGTTTGIEVEVTANFASGTPICTATPCSTWDGTYILTEDNCSFGLADGVFLYDFTPPEGGFGYWPCTSEAFPTFGYPWIFGLFFAYQCFNTESPYVRFEFGFRYQLSTWSTPRCSTETHELEVPLPLVLTTPTTLELTMPTASPSPDGCVGSGDAAVTIYLP